MGSPLFDHDAPRPPVRVQAAVAQDAHQDETRRTNEQDTSDDLSEEEASSAELRQQEHAAPVKLLCPPLPTAGTDRTVKNLWSCTVDNATELLSS